MRERREEVMFSPENYKKIVRKRLMNEKRREKRTNKGRHKEYVIRGTNVADSWLHGPKPEKQYKYKKRKSK